MKLLILFCLFSFSSLRSETYSWAKPVPDSSEVILNLPVDPEALKKDWTLTGRPTFVQDDLLKQVVIENLHKRPLDVRTKRSITGEFAVEATVRLHDAEAAYGYFFLDVGVRMDGLRAVPAFSCSLTRYRHSERGFSVGGRIGQGKKWLQPKREEGAVDPWGRGLVFQERFQPKRISPLWEPQFRTSIERDMSSLPLAKDVWNRIRLEVRKAHVRLWWNGILIGEDKNRLIADGLVSVRTQGLSRLSYLKVLRLGRSEPTPYVTVPLEPACNATGFVKSSTMPKGVVHIHDIPFQFSARSQRDHVDVGRSVFRYRKAAGGMNSSSPRHTWPGITAMDPARIRLRVPKSGYRRIWIVAAFDDEPKSTPILTARFFKPGRGWPIDCPVSVPSFRSKASEAMPLAVNMQDGIKGRLWMLPIEIDTAALYSDYREETAFHIELTKEVKDFRAFPDPMNYGSYQAGLPSGVRVYAMTLEKSPVAFISSGNRNGNVYPFPEQPVWSAGVVNQTNEALHARATFEISSPNGDSNTVMRAYYLQPYRSVSLSFEPETEVYGLHKVTTTVEAGDHSQSRQGTFLALPPDTRTEKGARGRWGLWCWRGGHGTNPNHEENCQILRAVGSMVAGHLPLDVRKQYGLAPDATLAERSTPKWALEDPYDPEEYKKFADEFGEKVVKYLEKTPDLGYVSIFAEHSVSLRTTHGNPPYVFGDKDWFDYTEEEEVSIRSHLIAAKAAFEGLRKHAPDVKFLFGHCGPQFSIPFMRAGYSKDLFDGYGLDSPQFERMPERPPRAVETNLMYYLQQEINRGGYDDASLTKAKQPLKELVHTESYYPSSHRLALGHRESADSMVRTAVLSLAFGSDKFYACWTVHDCEGYWGSQHYGCIGIISRRPEYNPKPSAAAFATMTQMLDASKYEGWLPTGSRTAYCVRFRKWSTNWVYAVWSIRGERPMAFTVKPGGTLTKVDENGNETPLEIKDGKATVTVSPTAFWIKASKRAIDKVEVGAPTHHERPGDNFKPLENFERDDWKVSKEPLPNYAENNWDVVRKPGPYSVSLVNSPDRKSKVLEIGLKETPPNAPLVSWYTVLTPPKPIPIPGKARALGIMANGNSGWGRIIYEVTDAKGEVFQSIGSKDDWNCDDVHSWAYMNFDGWRYVEFPLPSHSPGDRYREKDAVWWNHTAEEHVDLPLKLTRIIVEMQSHQIYVNEMLPVENKVIEIDDLIAVYESEEMMTDGPVTLQREAEGAVSSGSTQIAARSFLPNPIAEQAEAGVGAPTKILKLYPPQQYFDGTRVHVSIEPVKGATEYQVWLSAHSDGRGAIAIKKGEDSEPLITRLKPDFPLFFFVTYTDADGKPSKPSAVRKVVLKDEFPMK